MILYLDSTLLRQFTCIRRVHLLAIKGYQSKALGVDIEYGSAFHIFANLFEETRGDFNASFAPAKEYFDKTPMIIGSKKQHLTVNHLAKTCFSYQEYYDTNKDFEVLRDDTDKPLTEIKFSFPILEVDGITIMLCGTIDKIGKFKNGCYAIGDYKTTSFWDAKTYFESYRLSTQLRTYCYALKKICSSAPADSVLHKIANQQIGVFIEAIFLKPDKDAEFKRSEIFYPKDWEMVEFEQMLNKKAHELLALAQTVKAIPDYLPYREGVINGSCDGKFKCNYFNACASPDQIAFQHLMNRDFKLKEWNPLTLHE